MLFQGDNEFSLSASPFLAVTSVAEKLEVINVISATLRDWDDMIDGEILKGESDTTAVTDSLLASKECVLVRLVRRQLAYVGTLGNIFTVNKIVEKWSLCLYPLTYKFGRKRGEINADPLTVKTVSGYTGCSTTTKRIKHNIVLVAAGLDNAFQ